MTTINSLNMHKEKKDLRIVFMGTPDFAVGILDAMCQAGYNVVAVVTTPDKTAGRGKKLRSCAVKTYADMHHIPTLCPYRFKDEAFLDELVSYKADLQVVVAFKMLPKAIINGETETGVTTFFLDEKIDTGKVIMARQCAITPTETAGSLHDKLMLLGADCVLDTLALIAENKVNAMPQTTMMQEEPLKDAPKIFKQDCLIDWNREVQTVYNLIRGLSPYPAAWTTLRVGNKTLSIKIFETEIVTGHAFGSAAPGSLHSNGKDFLFVFTKDSKGLYIKKLQLEGKKAMPITDFLRGFKWEEGLSFE